jgi:hypothetical protein
VEILIAMGWNFGSRIYLMWLVCDGISSIFV